MRMRTLDYRLKIRCECGKDLYPQLIDCLINYTYCDECKCFVRSDSAKMEYTGAIENE